MHRRSFLSAAAVTTLLPFAARAADTPAPSDLKGDIAILRQALALHPGIYRYNTPRQIEDRLNALEPAFVAATDTAARYLLLSRFLGAVRCGHTQCNPYNQSDSLVASLYDRPTRLPFRFAWADKQMVVLKAPPEAPALVPGSIVTDLNSTAPSRILDALLPFARADGSNDAKRVAQMDMRDTDRFETFDVFQGLAFPPQGREHRVTFRDPSGRVSRIALPALTLAQRRARSPALDTTQNEKPFWSWRMEGDVAVLTMPTWVMYNTKWDWRSWLDDRLASLGGVRGLIIDLRENEGGNECGDAILARLAASDLRLPAYDERVRYRRTPAALNPFLDTWDRSFRSIGVNASDIGGGFYRLPGASVETVIPVEGPRLTLPVAALVGPACSSATYIFARKARQSGLVRLYGETTGGNLRGINGHGYFFVRLPASGIEFDVPIVGYFPPTPQPDAGVHPDVHVAMTARDIAAGHDPAMARALADIHRA